MTRGQRRIILIGLPAIAWCIHVFLCDWKYKTTRLGINAIVLFVEHDETVPFLLQVTGPRQDTTGGTIGRPTFTGIYPDRLVSRPTGALAGILLPMALVTLAGWLWLGWRHDDRDEHGLCVECGHDLRGIEHATCPECGHSVKNLLGARRVHCHEPSSHAGKDCIRL